MTDFTFAVCAYKDSPYLEEAILSVKNQSIPVEIIITTSTPSDYIRDLAAKYDIPCIVNPEKKGIAADWEFALSKIRTPYGAICHQDDVYLPEFAENTVKKFQENPDALIAFTDSGELAADSKIYPSRLYLWVKRLLLWVYYLKNVHRTRFFKRSAIVLGNAICCPSVSYNLSRVAPLHFNRDFTVNLDWAMWLALSEQKGAFAYIPKILMAHRISDAMESASAVNDSRRYNEDLAVFANIWGKTIAGFFMMFYKKAYSCYDNKK